MMASLPSAHTDSRRFGARPKGVKQPTARVKAMAGGAWTSHERANDHDAAWLHDAPELTADTFGPLDFNHNNASTCRPAPLADLSENDWGTPIVNSPGSSLHDYQLRATLPRATGSIINTASSVWPLSGSISDVTDVASKHNVEGPAETASLEASRYGVHIINAAAAPGPVAPTMTSVVDGFMAQVAALTSLLRFGQPDELDNAVAWLCSGSASYVDSVFVPVDGGRLAS